MEHLQYPIGKFSIKESYSMEEIQSFFYSIENIPSEIKNYVQNFSEIDLNTPYRPGGWTAKEVIHHLSDSHINSYCRIKLALTEENPYIKPYNELAWSKLIDYQSDINLSLELLDVLHRKWIILLKSLTDTDLQRTFYNPESGITYTILQSIAFYSWHGEHHFGHLKLVK